MASSFTDPIYIYITIKNYWKSRINYSISDSGIFRCAFIFAIYNFTIYKEKICLKIVLYFIVLIMLMVF
ncbi:hypothetical protein EBB54_01855 [Schaedlerella arabinosiphila]|uniref:Uncharacterized protein n=1 Tax=Schaedlerella arabinosiphila TaxID=2044587 RepID=A0A426DBW4_9FIRM|nr:hypothetical protein EBB54_01855 [Schaedlerella arabinosiphila]